MLDHFQRALLHGDEAFESVALIADDAASQQATRRERCLLFVLREIVPPAQLVGMTLPAQLSNRWFIQLPQSLSFYQVGDGFTALTFHVKNILILTKRPGEQQKVKDLAVGQCPSLQSLFWLLLLQTPLQSPSLKVLLQGCDPKAWRSRRVARNQVQSSEPKAWRSRRVVRLLQQGLTMP